MAPQDTKADPAAQAEKSGLMSKADFQKVMQEASPSSQVPSAPSPRGEIDTAPRTFVQTDRPVELHPIDYYLENQGQKGAAETFFDLFDWKNAPLIGGFVDKHRKDKITDAADRLVAGKPEKGDVDLVLEYAQEGLRAQIFGSSFAAEVVDVVGHSAIFAGEFAATAGFAKFAAKGTTMMLGELLGNSAKAVKLAEILGPKGIAAIRGATEIATMGAVRTATIGQGMIQSEMANQRLPGVSLTSDEQGRLGVIIRKSEISFRTQLLKAIGRTASELTTEEMGGFITKLVPGSRHLAALEEKAIAWVAGKSGAPFMDVARKLAKKGAWDGLIGEMGEERANDLFSYLMGDLKSPIPSGHQLAVEGVSFSIPGFGFAGARRAAHETGRYLVYRQEKRIQKNRDEAGPQDPGQALPDSEPVARQTTTPAGPNEAAAAEILLSKNGTKGRVVEPTSDADRWLAAAAAALGRRLVLVESEDGKPMKFAGVAHGDTMALDANASGNARRFLWHETVHTMEESERRALIESIKADYPELFQIGRDAYEGSFKAQGGGELSDDAKDEEAVAALAEDWTPILDAMFGDPEILNRVRTQHRSLWVKIKDAIKTALKRLHIVSIPTSVDQDLQKIRDTLDEPAGTKLIPNSAYFGLARRLGEILQSRPANPKERAFDAASMDEEAQAIFDEGRGEDTSDAGAVAGFRALLDAGYTAVKLPTGRYAPLEEFVRKAEMVAEDAAKPQQPDPNEPQPAQPKAEEPKAKAKPKSKTQKLQEKRKKNREARERRRNRARNGEYGANNALRAAGGLRFSPDLEHFTRKESGEPDNEFGPLVRSPKSKGGMSIDEAIEFLAERGFMAPFSDIKDLEVVLEADPISPDKVDAQAEEDRHQFEDAQAEIDRAQSEVDAAIARSVVEGEYSAGAETVQALYDQFDHDGHFDEDGTFHAPVWLGYLAGWIIGANGEKEVVYDPRAAEGEMLVGSTGSKARAQARRDELALQRLDFLGDLMIGEAKDPDVILTVIQGDSDLDVLDSLGEDGRAVLVFPNSAGSKRTPGQINVSDDWNVDESFELSEDVMGVQTQVWVIRGKRKQGNRMVLPNPDLYSSYGDIEERALLGPEGARPIVRGRNPRRKRKSDRKGVPKGTPKKGTKDAGGQGSSGDGGGVQPEDREASGTPTSDQKRPGVGDRGSDQPSPEPGTEGGAPAGGGGEQQPGGGGGDRGGRSPGLAPSDPADLSPEAAKGWIEGLIDEEFDAPPAPEPSGAPQGETPDAGTPKPRSTPRNPKGTTHKPGGSTSAGTDGPGADWAGGLNDLFAVERPKDFDEDKYRQAVPFFGRAAHEKGATVDDLPGLVQKIIQHMRTAYGFTRDRLLALSMYLSEFARDIARGYIGLDGVFLEQTEGGDETQHDKKDSVDPENQHQVVHEAATDAASLETVAPAYLEDAMQEALEALKAEVGDLVDFVAEELGVDRKVIIGTDGNYGTLGSEQVEALALAIWNAKQGIAFVVGDQTGVGKGRVAASMVDWAHKQGLTPVFVTEGPKLYRDIMRDFKAIRRGSLNPLVTNSDLRGEGAIELEGGGVIASLPPRDYKTAMFALEREGKLPFDHDVLFTTYDQFNRSGQKLSARHPILEALLKSGKAFLVMDESHTAGGSAKETDYRKIPRSDDFRDFSRQAAGVMYLSATVAKNPRVWTLYNRLEAAEVFDGNMAAVRQALEAGGVPAEQAFVRMLAQSGQLVRRERSYDGIPVDPVEIDVNTEHAEEVSSILRDLVELDEIIHNNIDPLIADVIREHYVWDPVRKVMVPPKVRHDRLTNYLHNIATLALFSLKAEGIAQRAIEAAKDNERGRPDRRVLISIANTGAAVLDAYIKSQDDNIEYYGQSLRMADHKKAEHYRLLLNDLSDEIEKVRRKGELTEHDHELLAQLRRKRRKVSEGYRVELANDYSIASDLSRSFRGMFRVSIKPAGGETVVHQIPVDRVYEVQSARLIERFEAVAERLASSETLRDMNASPLDYILWRVRQAGIEIEEVTGRDRVVFMDEQGRPDRWDRRKSGPAISNQSIDNFNNRGTRILIGNNPLQTGSSAHASSEFRNQEPRLHLTAQPHPDINKQVQGFGRINRYGQVVTPSYEILSSGIPYERKLVAMLLKRMAELNANTTSSADSPFMQIGGIDYLNRFGDRAFAALLQEDTDLRRSLHIETGELTSEGLSRKISTRAILLPWKEQEELFNTLERAYRDFIELKEAMGGGVSAATLIDLQAKTISTTEILPARSPSVFGQGLSVEEVDARVVDPPIPVDAMLKEAENAAPVETLSGELRERTQPFLEDVKRRSLELIKERKPIQSEIDRLKRAVDPTDEAQLAEKERHLAELGARNARLVEKIHALTSTQHTTEYHHTLIGQMLRQYAPGAVVTLASPRGIFMGVVVGQRSLGKTKNPTSLSDFRLSLRTTATKRLISLPLSAIQRTGEGEVQDGIALSVSSEEQIRSIVDQITRHGRTRRKIVTGNPLLAARYFSHIGKMGLFTRADGSTEMGVILNHQVDARAEFDGQPTPMDLIPAAVELLADSDSQVTLVSPYGPGPTIQGNELPERGGRVYDILVSKQDGVKWRKSAHLRGFGLMWKKMRDNRGFQARVQEEQLSGLIQAYQQMGASFSSFSSRAPGVLEQHRAQRGTFAGLTAKRSERDGPRFAVERDTFHSRRLYALFADGKFNGETRLDWVLRNVQNYFLRFFRIQEALEQMGYDIPDDENLVQMEEKFQSRAQHNIKKFRASEVDALLQFLLDNGLTLKDLHLYAYALHVPKRNRAMFKRQQEKENGPPPPADENAGPMFDDGKRRPSINEKRTLFENAETEDTFAQEVRPLSGMKRSEALAIIAKWRGSKKAKEIHEAAKMLREINRETLALTVRAGLLTEEEARGMRKRFGVWYVPLKTDMLEEHPAVGQGFSLPGAEFKTAKGRGTLADNVVAFTMMQREEKIIRAEKARLDLGLYKFVLHHPHPRLWVIKRERRARTVGPDGIVRDHHVPLRKQVDEHTVYIKVRGETYSVQFKDKLMARAWKRIGYFPTNPLVRMAGVYNRLLSSLDTSKNPGFIIPNFSRDLLESAIHVAGERSTELMGRVVLNVEKGIMGSWHVLRESDVPERYKEHAKYFEELQAAGGTVGWYYAHDYGQKMLDLEKKMRELDPSNGRKLYQTLLGTPMEALEDASTAVENGVRLSLYVELRKLGVSVEKAASAAKNLTVNFNRRGEMGPILNSFYLFFNANVQGTARMAWSLKNNKRTQKIAMAIVLGSIAVDMLNRAVAPTDPDGENQYDKIPDWIKQRNLIIMNPFGGGVWAMLPMPYGYSIFSVFGRAFSEMLPQSAGGAGKDAEEVFSSSIGALWSAFMPLGGESDVWQVVSPTFSDPIVQVWSNKTFYGGQIRPKDRGYGPPKPRSELYWSTVNPTLRGFTKWMNQVTGGDQWTAGKADVSPEVLEHFIDFAGGGLGQMLQRTWKLPSLIRSEQPVEFRDIPIVRRFLGEPWGEYDRGKFWQNVGEIEHQRARFRGYLSQGNMKAARNVQTEYGRLIGLNESASEARKVIKVIKVQLPAASREERTRLRGMAARIYADFNRQVLETK